MASEVWVKTLDVAPTTRRPRTGTRERVRVARRTQAREAAERVVSPPEPLRLDVLAGQWWTALDAARSALRACGRSLSAQELADRAGRLDEERTRTLQLLQDLGHDLQTESPLLRLLAAPAITPRMLGLPDGVSACVFDLDGVLTTSASVHAAAWAETFDLFLLERAERSHHPFIPFDRRRDYADYIAGKPRLDGVRAFLAARGISLPEGAPGDPPDTETVHGLSNRKSQAMQRRLDREGVAAFEGSRSYLEAARMLGLRRAVVSASAHTATILERAGLSHLVDRRIDGATITARQLRGKPAPDTVLAACELLDVQPRQAAAFETTPAGIAGARAAGVKVVIGVERNGHAAALRASDADLVVNDLGELLRAG